MVPSERKKQQAQAETQGIAVKKKKKVGVNLAGHSPEQPALLDPALSRKAGLGQ